MPQLAKGAGAPYTPIVTHGAVAAPAKPLADLYGEMANELAQFLGIRGPRRQGHPSAVPLIVRVIG